MPLALIVSVLVLGVTACVGAVGYLIEKSAKRAEREQH
jgi:hypothetical protein